MSLRCWLFGHDWAIDACGGFDPHIGFWSIDQCNRCWKERGEGLHVIVRSA